MEKPVARVGDSGSHGGSINTGASTIFVNDRPMARVGDTYACPKHGPNPIVTGAPSVFGQGQLVAHVGSKTACGATITSGSPDTFVGTTQSNVNALSHGFVTSILDTIFGTEPPPIPGMGLPQEVVCAKLAGVRASKQVQKKLREVIKLSKENKWEYTGWIVEDPPISGNFDIVNISTDKELLSCTPGPKPSNAVGEFHTHPNAGLAYPSEQDQFFVTRQPEKVPFYLIFANSGHEAMQNDEGEEFSCTDYKPFFSVDDTF